MQPLSYWEALIPALAIVVGLVGRAGWISVRWIVQVNRLLKDVESHLTEANSIAKATEATRLLVAENTVHIADLIKGRQSTTLWLRPSSQQLYLQWRSW